MNRPLALLKDAEACVFFFFTKIQKFLKTRRKIPDLVFYNKGAAGNRERKTGSVWHGVIPYFKPRS